MTFCRDSRPGAGGDNKVDNKRSGRKAIPEEGDGNLADLDEADWYFDTV